MKRFVQLSAASLCPKQSVDAAGAFTQTSRYPGFAHATDSGVGVFLRVFSAFFRDTPAFSGQVNLVDQ